MGNNPQEFDIIFRAALTEIESGRETLASVLAQHPEVAEELRPQLEAALWMHGRKRLVEPRPEFLAASRQRLVAQIQGAGLAGASAAPAVVRRPAAKTWQPTTRWTLSFALILMAVFSIFLIGEMLTYASQDSLPGEVLYPVKLASEKARLALSLKPSGDAELYIEYAQRRLSEIEQLTLEGRYDQIPEAVQRFDTSVTQALRSLDAISISDSDLAFSLATKLEQMLALEPALLNTLAGTVPINVREDIEKAIQIVVQGWSAVQDILEETEPTPTPSASATPEEQPAEIVALTPTPTSSPEPRSGDPSVTPTPLSTFDNAEVTTTPVQGRPSNTPTLPSLGRPSHTPTPTITPTPTRTPTPTNNGDDDEGTKPPTKPPNTHKPPTHTPKPEEPSRPSKPARP